MGCASWTRWGVGCCSNSPVSVRQFAVREDIVTEDEKMGHTLVSLKDFLQERHLIRKNNVLSLAQARERLEKSQLVRRMRDICVAINAEAGSVIVDEHQYLPPESVISSFTFTRGQTEYTMQLEFRGARPALVFVRRTWCDASSNKLYSMIYWLVRSAPLSLDIKYSCELQEECASDEEIKQCFYYLLSGLRRSCIPRFRSCKNSSKGRGRE